MSTIANTLCINLAVRGGSARLSVCGSAAGQVDHSMIVEPKPSNGEAFPESTASAPGILTIKADPNDLACPTARQRPLCNEVGHPAPPSHH